MTVVIDTNVFISAVFWAGADRKCFSLWARRQFQLAVSISILEEYSEIAKRVGADYPAVNPEPWLAWVEEKAKIYEPALLGKQRSVDADDDIFLACALASGAKMIVSKDPHLLNLQKPFGIRILTPRQFLQTVRSSS